MFSRIKNYVLDKSVYFSFDMTGYDRHKKFFPEFQEDISKKSCKGRYGLITGGTSGIGKYCAKFLSERQANIYITGRNVAKGENLADQNDHLHFVPLDMASWEQISTKLQDIPKLDYLVLNAGGMPDSFQTNRFGVESQFASQLMGHLLLLDYFIKSDKLSSNARIVWVTSGGMYLRKLTIDQFERDPYYNKVSTYANVKRAQVILVEELVKSEPYSKFVMNCMHPGWVDTPGVQTAIPEFREKTKNRLRNEHAGADTILWLLLTQNKLSRGELYFDRQTQKKYSFGWTKESRDTREEFLNIVFKYKKAFSEEKA